MTKQLRWVQGKLIQVNAEFDFASEYEIKIRELHLKQF